MPSGAYAAKKYNAGNRCKYKTSDDAGDIADLKSPLFLIEEAGKTQSTECQRIVQEHLRDCVENRLQHELHQAVSHCGHNADIRTIPVSDQNDEKHGQQSDGTPIGMSNSLIIEHTTASAIATAE